jgi:hypothetical protein
LAVGEEAVLREDGDFVCIDGDIRRVEDARDLDDAAGGELAEAFSVIPLRVSRDVDGEVAAVRTLDDEGLRAGVDADDGGVELVEIRSGIGGQDGRDVEGGCNDAGDLALAVDLDGLAQIEVEMQARRSLIAK